MIGKDEERDTLIYLTLDAGTTRDAEVAHAHADAWLEKNLGDLRILAAQERLDEGLTGVRDPGHGADRVTSVAYLCAFSVVALVVFALTGRLYAAWLTGLLVVFGFPWDGAGKAIGEWHSGPRIPGRETGER